MPTKTTGYLIVSFCVLAFLASTGASENAVHAQKCDDASILTNISSKIAQNKTLSSQSSHINIVVVNAAVKLQGWTDSKSSYDLLYGIISKTECVRLININQMQDAPPPDTDQMRSSGGCVGGTKPCGDICIPEGDSCNIKAGSKDQE